MESGRGAKDKPAVTPTDDGRVVAAIGRKAGVVVATTEKSAKRDGKLTTTVQKFASMHDLRRAFGTRWAKRVMPAVLDLGQANSERIAWIV
jgi:hypothetical protein